MTVDTKRVNAVLAELVGTCGSLSDHATEQELNDDEFLKAIDDEAFECNTCGWWCEIGDLADDDTLQDQTCQQCHDDS